MSTSQGRGSSRERGQGPSLGLNLTHPGCVTLGSDSVLGDQISSSGKTVSAKIPCEFHQTRTSAEHPALPLAPEIVIVTHNSDNDNNLTTISEKCGSSKELDVLVFRVGKKNYHQGFLIEKLVILAA